MKTTELYKKLNEIIPSELSCEWDNDGLSVLPYKAHESRRILVALDVRNEVIGYAEKNGFDTIVTHHPLIFLPLKELSGESVVSEKALRLARAGIAAISFHTRFDALDGGVSDMLCKKLGFTPTMKFGEGLCARLCGIGEHSFDELAAYVKGIFGPAHFFSEKATEKVRSAAVCGGAAEDLIPDAKALGADVFICGEVKYHNAIDAADSGMNVICVGHYESEAPALEKLRDTVSKAGGEYVEIYGVKQYAV